jgi:hypothetical protein
MGLYNLHGKGRDR